MTRTQAWAAALAAITFLVAACGRDTKNDAAMSSAEPFARDMVGSAPASQRAVALTAGESAAPDAQVSDRKLVVNVFLDLVMADVQSGFERIGRIAEAQGGLVADSTIRQDRNGERRATITVRVPVNRHQEALAQIRDLAVEVESERTSANDVTEEYTDLESRLRNLEASEQQILALLAQARNVQEILLVQERLNATRSEIERIKGRLTLLTRLTDLATIQAQLRPDPSPATGADGGLLAALQRGWNASLDVLGVVALAVLTAIAFSWWLLPIALVGIWLLRRILRRRPAPVEPAAAPEGA
jgi:hypothetical protein